jgi:hypothetical protein
MVSLEVPRRHRCICCPPSTQRGVRATYIGCLADCKMNRGSIISRVAALTTDPEKTSIEWKKWAIKIDNAYLLRSAADPLG